MEKYASTSNLTSRSQNSHRPGIKPGAYPEDEIYSKTFEPKSRPPSPEMDSPIVSTKLKSKIPKSGRRIAERAMPLTPSGKHSQTTLNTNNKYLMDGKLNVVGTGKLTNPPKGGAIGRVEIKLPETRPGTQPMTTQAMGGRYNYQLEINELRTLLKLPRDTPSVQAVHKLREAFHLMDVVDRYKADLQRLLQNKEAKTHEGVIKTVKDLLMENESLKQNVDRHQEIIVKLQEDKKAVLERFHKLVREHRIRDYGSGSLLTLTNQESMSSSQEGGLGKSLSASANLVPSASFGELTVTGTGEKKDLATMLSSKIDHMLKPTVSQNNEQKGLSPIYIRQKRNKDEKKMVYKITGIIRPASSMSSLEERPTMTGSAIIPVTASQQKKLPEIFAKKKTPTPTQKLKILIDDNNDNISIVSNPANSSLVSVTDTSVSSLNGGNGSDVTTDTVRSSRTGSTTRRIRIRTTEKGRSSISNANSKHPNGSNLVSMSKRYSSSALSAGGSVGQHMPPPPSSITEQEESIGDMISGMSDIKKDDLISLIFAPLLKDRYMAKFSVDSEGGVLIMHEIGVSLVIPSGAIQTDTKSEIILGISYNPIDTPITPYSHTNTSSTIMCATNPPDLKFKRSVLLAFAHNSGSLELSKQKGIPRILQSFTDIGHSTKWRDFKNLEDEYEREIGCVSSEYCIVYVNELRLFSMVMEQNTSRMPSKKVRVVVYVSYSPGRDCVALNVFCIDSLPSERQLLRRECSQDHSGIEMGEQPMVMNANEGDIIVSVRNLPSGWQFIGQSHQSLPYRKVWQNLHPHVTFLLQCAPDTWESELSCTVHTQQLKTDDQNSSTHIAICCDLAQMEGCSESSMFDNGAMTGDMLSFLKSHNSEYFTPNIFDTGSSNILLQDTDSDDIGEELRHLLFNIAWPRESRSPNIPEMLIREMSSMLDPPNLLGLDWRQLASELDMDSCVPALNAVGRACGHLLLAAEVLFAGLYELQVKLERMGREDVGAVVRGYIARMELANAQKQAAEEKRIKARQPPFSSRF